eukprot:1365858-Rhodomonas_salina.1
MLFSRSKTRTSKIRISLLWPIVVLLLHGDVQRHPFRTLCAADTDAAGSVDAATQGTANELYVKARTYEDQKQLLHALRTFKAGQRLVPNDARFRKKLKQLAAMIKGYIAVEGSSTRCGALAFQSCGDKPSPNAVHGGVRLPVLVPSGAHALTPGSPGSADDLVATFFKWQRIAIFRNDSDQCAIHSAGQDTIFTVMGHTCLSSVYVAAHNLVQGIFSGHAAGSWDAAIPNASRVDCGAPCGVDVPPLPPSLVLPADARCPLLWEGSVKGYTIEICRGEERLDALSRLIGTGRLPDRCCTIQIESSKPQTWQGNPS